MNLTVPLGLILAAGLAIAPISISSESSETRPDCPGKIVCPLTGDLVCKDRCPLNGDADAAASAIPACCTRATVNLDPARPDCPGRIVCPLTGELVCKDRCPLNEAKDPAPEDVPACCLGKRSPGGGA